MLKFFTFKNISKLNINKSLKTGITSLIKRPLITTMTNSLKPKINSLIQLSKFRFTTTEDKNKELEDFLKQYESHVREANLVAIELLKNLQNEDEVKIMVNLEALNNMPIRYPHLVDIKEYIINNIEKIPLTRASSLIRFLQFVDKLELDNFEDYFGKIERKFRHFIENGKLNIEELSQMIYAYSKYQIVDKQIWTSFYHQLDGNISELKLESTSQIFLAFTMIQSTSENINLLTKEEYDNLYKQLIKNIENRISELSFLDTFRICISMTKRPVNITDLSENLWKALQENFKKEINTFDLYQMSQILLLFCETPYLDQGVFQAVETELISEYMEKIDEISQTEGFNVNSLLEDLSKISFAFALSRQGSQYYWSLILKTFIKLKENISLLATENLLFICYRLIDYLSSGFTQFNQTQDESMKNLLELFKILEDKILKEKLVESHKIDPFNTMMPFARFGNINSKIWNNLIKNIMSALNSQKTINPFLLNDVIFALSNYYINLILERDSGNIEINKEFNQNSIYYLSNFKQIWSKIEDLIISQDETIIEVPHLGNMIIDLSQIDLDLEKAWSYLSELVRVKIDQFDVNNFVMVLMGFSKKDFKSPTLWKLFEDFVKVHINEFSIEDLRKIIISFLKHKEISKEFWRSLEERFTEEDILNKLNLEYFVDLQIPFAITGITNDKIWNKFEEIIFKNLKIFETDKDYLMNTVYSFSRSGKGSPTFWNKFASIISRDLNGYDIDDLGHIAVCLRSEYLIKNRLEKILDENFWNNLIKNVEQKLPSAKLNSLNNLLRGIKENEYLNKNQKLITNIEKRIEQLIKDIPK